MEAAIEPALVVLFVLIIVQRLISAAGAAEVAETWILAVLVHSTVETRTVAAADADGHGVEARDRRLPVAEALQLKVRVRVRPVIERRRGVDLQILARLDELLQNAVGSEIEVPPDIPLRALAVLDRLLGILMLEQRDGVILPIRCEVGGIAARVALELSIESLVVAGVGVQDGNLRPRAVIRDALRSVVRTDVCRGEPGEHDERERGAERPLQAADHRSFHGVSSISGSAGARPAAVVDSDAVFDIERSVHALPSVMTVSKPASAARTVASMIWAATPRRSIARTRSATGR